MIILTKEFWQYAGERALKTFAQTLISGLAVTGIAGVADVAWLPVLSTAVLATIISVLTSIVAIKPAQPDIVE